MIDVDLKYAYRLLGLGSVVMVSSYDENDVPNLMTCAWNCCLDFDPPKAILVLGSGSKTRANIEKTHELIINIPSNKQKDLVLAVGSKHGFDVNKFEENNIEAKKSKLVNAPVVDGCIGYLECKVIDEPEMQKKYDIVMVEIVAAYADEQAFDGQKYTLNSELTTIHHLADDKLVATGNII